MAEIRTLTIEEIPNIKPFLQALAGYHNEVATSFRGMNPIEPLDESIADATSRVRDNHGTVFGLFDDKGDMAGFCGVQYYGKNGEVDWLYVNKEVRGQGWGVKLLDAAMACLKANGAEFIDIYVIKGNPATDLYTRLGFEERVTVLSKRI